MRILLMDQNLRPGELSNPTFVRYMNHPYNMQARNFLIFFKKIRPGTENSASPKAAYMTVRNSNFKEGHP